MQDVTHHAFLRVLHRRGDPDACVTEYFRVHPGSRLAPEILRCIEDPPVACPVVGQLIGKDREALVQAAVELERRGAAGVDINLGCPAPVVYRKCAGGGLLRHPDRIDDLLGALRAALSCPLTVKTRIGFDSAAEFPRLIEIFARHRLDGLAVHGRTVRDGYRTPVDIAAIRLAVEVMDCPVIANGSAVSPATARALRTTTGAAGVMIGRGAIRNPWIFRQLRGDDACEPTWDDILHYIEELWEATRIPGTPEKLQVQAMKRYMNFIGEGVDADGGFLHAIRRAETASAFFDLCHRAFDRPGGPAAEPPGGSSRFAGFEQLLEEPVRKPIPRA